MESSKLKQAEAKCFSFAAFNEAVKRLEEPNQSTVGKCRRKSWAKQNVNRFSNKRREDSQSYRHSSNDRFDRGRSGGNGHRRNVIWTGDGGGGRITIDIALVQEALNDACGFIKSNATPSLPLSPTEFEKIQRGITAVETLGMAFDRGWLDEEVILHGFAGRIRTIWHSKSARTFIEAMGRSHFKYFFALTDAFPILQQEQQETVVVKPTRPTSFWRNIGSLIGGAIAAFTKLF